MKMRIIFIGFLMIFLGWNSNSYGAIEAGNSFIINYPTQSQLAGPHGTEGPFYMTMNGGDPPAEESFLTFCVETTRYFYPGHTYTVLEPGPNDHSMMTNRNLSGYTAWIYTMFRGEDEQWQLPEYFNTMTKQSYDILQYAVWAGMTRGTPSSTSVGAGGDDSTKAEQTFGQWNSYLQASWTEGDLHEIGLGLADFEASGWGTDEGYSDPYTYLDKVRVLNLTGDFEDAQDQLCFADGESIDPLVPEPISFMVWSLIGLSICGAACWQWRRKRIL
jgi:hypothetical protein